jgi:hypothetical protein
MGELAQLELDEDEAAQQAVVEDLLRLFPRRSSRREATWRSSSRTDQLSLAASIS